MPSSDQGASSSLSSPITFAAENSSESSVGRVPGIAAPAIPGSLNTSAEDAAIEDEPTFAKVVRIRTLRGTVRRGASERPLPKTTIKSSVSTPAASVTRSGSRPACAGSSARGSSRGPASVIKGNSVKKERGASIPPVLTGNADKALEAILKELQRVKGPADPAAGGGDTRPGGEEPAIGDTTMRYISPRPRAIASPREAMETPSTGESSYVVVGAKRENDTDETNAASNGGQEEVPKRARSLPRVSLPDQVAGSGASSSSGINPAIPNWTIPAASQVPVIVRPATPSAGDCATGYYHCCSCR